MRYFLLLCLFVTCYSFGQQLPHMSQWSQHQLAINPAHAGLKSCLEVQGTVRGQWIKLEGAPVTGWVSLSAPLPARRKKIFSGRHGIGGLFVTDQFGPFSRFDFQLSYAGHFNFSQDTRLSLGVAFGGTQLAFDIAKATPLTPDPVINGSAVELKPNATFGAWWNGENYYMGLALYQLIPQKWKMIGSTARSQMHGMFNAGGRIGLVEGWTLLPGIYIGKVKAAPFDVQAQLLFDYKNTLLTGIGFRNKDAIIAFLGTRIGTRFKLMYSYDFIISPFQKGTLHSHELTLNFSPCKVRSAEILLCPMFE